MCAASIGKKQGFNRYECKILCNQIIKYKNELNSFDLDIALVKDNSLNQWRYIDTELKPPVLAKIAFHLFSICPNSASSKQDFSTLEWLFNKRHLNLNLKKLKAMSK